ncbi:MAG: hypothetical protein H5U19_09050 [Rhodobacteraceae bacterium]|jgi:hypothetical protein|nr:hypothetical protein [Paracoccaceae bacterium]
MFIGLILVGSGLGGVSAVAALMLGHSIWMAILIYSIIGVLSVLAGAIAMAMRPDAAHEGDHCKPYQIARPQRG